MFQAWVAKKGRHACISLLSPNDLKTLPDRDVMAFYQTEFWGPCHCEQLPLGVDHSCFDFAVMSGQGTMVKALQTCLGFTGKDVDGEIGPHTLGAAQTANAQELIVALKELREKYYNSLPNTAANPGWIPRVIQVCAESISMLDKPLAKAEQ